MARVPQDPIRSLMGLLFRAHPWHGVDPGADAPHALTCYIEMVPTDTVKYELDKDTGLLKLDRPQLYSNICPALYGLVPRTYCGDRVGALCAERAGRDEVVGDGDPLDICVITERTIEHGDLLLQARPLGGLRLIDGNEADDKIVAVLRGDAAYSGFQDISECPPALVERLRHYFLTYKRGPGQAEERCQLIETYGRDDAHVVIRAAMEDYDERFRGLESLFGRAPAGGHEK